MNKISITIDVTKINKSKIVDSSYKNKDGKIVSKKEYKMELIPMKEPKLIKDGGSWILKKTHFIVEQQTPEERDRKEKSVFVGEGLTFFDNDNTTSEDVGIGEDINPDDIPF